MSTAGCRKVHEHGQRDDGLACWISEGLEVRVKGTQGCNLCGGSLVEKPEGGGIGDARLAAQQVSFLPQDRRKGRQAFIHHQVDVPLRVAPQPLCSHIKIS